MKTKIMKTSAAGLSVTVIASASYALMEPIPDFQEKIHIEIPNAENLIQPEFETENLLEQLQQANTANWREHEIKPGENLSVIFSKLGLSKKTLHEILQSNDLGKELASLQPGNIIKVKAEDDKLTKLIYEKSPVERLRVSKTGDGFEIKKVTSKVETEIGYVYAIIDSSFYLNAKERGLPDKHIMKLTSIFGWDVDFTLDIREGDQLTVIYEKNFVDGKEIEAGDILAAEFINQGKSYKTVRYVDKDGNVNYYTPEGATMRKAFLRAPVDFALISSYFNLKRKHPVLNRIRAHKGVDYAASTGTPVRTTGDGKIVFRGRKGGYGNVVIIDHGNNTSTLYAHLSRFDSNLRDGSKVRQGDVVGYVGMTGLATGPHLHYEFQVNGVHKDPLKVQTVQAEPIDTAFLADFKQSTFPLLSQLEKVKTTLVASADKLYRESLDSTP